MRLLYWLSYLLTAPLWAAGWTCYSVAWALTYVGNVIHEATTCRLWRVLHQQEGAQLPPSVKTQPPAVQPVSGNGAQLDNVRTVGVNSVRWLCPKCVHINAACPSAPGHVFVCEKCGTRARVVLSL